MLAKHATVPIRNQAQSMGGDERCPAARIHKSVASRFSAQCIPCGIDRKRGMTTGVIQPIVAYHVCRGKPVSFGLQHGFLELSGFRPVGELLGCNLLIPTLSVDFLPQPVPLFIRCVKLLPNIQQSWKVVKGIEVKK